MQLELTIQKNLTNTTNTLKIAKRKLRRITLKNALIVEPNDIKQLIAEKYEVSTDKIKSTGYSYYVELDKVDESCKNNN